MHASDLDRLVAFYIDALDCRLLVPPTQIPEPVSLGAGSAGETVQIAVLGLPGFEDGPTLELIRIGDHGEVGQGLLTFYVDDVHEAAERVVGAGGAYKGEIVDIGGPGGRTSRFVFMTDPEGNVVDLVTSVQ